MSKENLVLKLKVEVDTQTASELDGQSRICNWLYNHLLEKSHDLKKQFIQSGDSETAKTLYTKRGLRNILPLIKQEHPFLKVVHSSPLKNTALRLSEAIQSHQINISVETTRQLMIQSGVWEYKSKKSPVIHQQRKRRSSLGELVQVEPARHCWQGILSLPKTTLNYSSLKITNS